MSISIKQSNTDFFRGLAALFLASIFGTVAFSIYALLLEYRAFISKAVFYSFCLVLAVLMSCVIAAAAFFMVRLWQLAIEKNLENEQIRATLWAAKNTSLMFDATAQRIATGQVYLSNYKTSDAQLSVKAIPREIKQPVPALEIENQPEILIKDSLLDDIKTAQRLLLVGGQNSGKTTLLKHIAKQRSGNGSVLVFDSHNALGKWNADYTIVGHGRDYPAIERELISLVETMDCRYKELATGKVGEREHELITIISDEWTTVSKNINNLDAYLLPLLTESRKVGIDLILATHSQTAESLGLKGKADLKSAFDAILTLKNIAGKRVIDFDNNEEKVVYLHPGAFTDYQPVKSKPIELVKDDFVLKLDEIMQEDLQFDLKVIDAFYELKNSGDFSWNKLSKIVYDNKVNGRYVADLKAVLARHNIETTQ